jgi:DNA-binding MarR family transcriptional regulator
VPLDIEDLGPQLVKNIAAPIQAFLAHLATPHPAKAIPLVHSHVEFYLIRRVHSLCMQALSEIGESAGLAGTDIPALAPVIDEPGLSPYRLAERLGIKPAAGERCATRLERRGLITRRRSSAGRLWALSATPEGTETRLRLRAAVRAAQDRILAPLSESDRGVLREFLVRVIEANTRRAGG